MRISRGSADVTTNAVKVKTFTSNRYRTRTRSVPEKSQTTLIALWVRANELYCMHATTHENDERRTVLNKSKSIDYRWRTEDVSNRQRDWGLGRVGRGSRLCRETGRNRIIGKKKSICFLHDTTRIEYAHISLPRHKLTGLRLELIVCTRNAYLK